MKHAFFEQFSIRRCEHTFLDYPMLFDRITAIKDVHVQMAREVGYWRMPLYKWYAQVRAWVLREQRKDMGHLVKRMYESITEFRKEPESVLDRQPFFTQEMAFYSREMQKMKMRAAEKRNGLARELGSLEAELKKEQQDGRTETAADLERESITREDLRAYVTKGHEYQVVQEYIRDLKREQYFADRKEEIALNSIYTAAGVVEKAEALEAQVRSVQTLYTAAVKKHYCLPALYGAVSRQREVIGDMERMLIMSQDRVMQLDYGDWNVERSTFLEGLHVDEDIMAEMTAPLVN